MSRQKLPKSRLIQKPDREHLHTFGAEMRAAGRAKISAAAKARWAKVKAAGKKSL